VQETCHAHFYTFCSHFSRLLYLTKVEKNLVRQLYMASTFFFFLPAGVQFSFNLYAAERRRRRSFCPRRRRFEYRRRRPPLLLIGKKRLDIGFSRKNPNYGTKIKV